MNYKLVAAFGIALVVGCGASRTGIVPDGIANAGGNGGAGGSSSSTAEGGSAPGCTCDVPDMSGTRLKVALIEGADGSRVNTGLFEDTQLGTVCSFRIMSDGSAYCVPEHVVMNTFLDAECKLPVYLLTHKTGKCAPTLPTFASFIVRGGSACTDNFAGFRIYSADTNVLQNVTNWYVLDQDNNCSNVGLQVGVELVAYSVSLLGTQDGFVKATYPQGL